MKLLLLSLLLIGVSAKDKTKDKDTIHDLVYKDENILNFGEVGKVKIHQRLDNLNIDATQRHLLNDISVNVDRCINGFNDDYKTNKDVQKYRYSVGNLVGIVLGQIGFLERNNMFNNVGFIDNLINRLRLCDVVIRDSDISNNNQMVDWRDSWNRDNTNRDINVNRYTGRFVDSNVLRGGVNVYRDIDRDWDTNTYRGVDREDIYGRRVGDNVNRFGVGNDLNNDRTYGRTQRDLSVVDSLNNDLGIVSLYRVIFGLVNEDDNSRDFGNVRDKNIYGYNVNRLNRLRGTYGNYGDYRLNRFDNNRDINGNYDDNYNRLNRDKDAYNYGTNWNRYDNYRNVLWNNRNDYDRGLYNNRYGYDYDRDVYGRGGDYRNDRSDIDSNGRRDLNWIAGGDRDVLGRRTGYYKTDTNDRDSNNYNRYLVEGRDNRLDTYVD